MSNSVQEQTLATVFARYDRRVMNNIHRADYVECLVATLLGPAWTLPWTSAYDWAPWDLEHVSGARIEVKQAAARQPWHRGESVPARPPRFDIAPRRGAYWTLDSTWVEQPGRLADIYIFAWHPETRERIVDHREPEQWTFFVLRTETVPAAQRSISLARCREARPHRPSGIAHPDGQADAEARRRSWGHPHLSASRHGVGRVVHAETVLELVDGLGSPADDGEYQNPWGQTARSSSV